MAMDRRARGVAAVLAGLFLASCASPQLTYKQLLSIANSGETRKGSRADQDMRRREERRDCVARLPDADRSFKKFLNSPEINQAKNVAQKDLEEIARACQASPEAVKASFYLGEMYLILQRPQAALEWLSKAAAVRSSFRELAERLEAATRVCFVSKKIKDGSNSEDLGLLSQLVLNSARGDTNEMRVYAEKLKASRCSELQSIGKWYLAYNKDK